MGQVGTSKNEFISSSHRADLSKFTKFLDKPIENRDLSNERWQNVSKLDKISIGDTILKSHPIYGHGLLLSIFHILELVEQNFLKNFNKINKRI